MTRPPRVDAPGSAFFVTTITHGRQRFFERQELATTAMQILDEERRRGTFGLFAYVLMPDHGHLILQPADGSLSEIMRRWKSLTWRRCRDEHGLQGKLWQEGFFDEGIRSARQLRSQIDYIHLNPVRAGLVEGAEQWPWSSFGAWEGMTVPVMVDPIEV